MTDIEEFKLSTYHCIKEIRCTTVNRISLVQTPWDSKTYIQRILTGDKRPVYEKLQKLSLEGIPKIEELIYDGNTYVIEEYIQGTLLSEISLPDNILFSVLTSVLHILHTLHQQDIIHCDIKADNIIITKENKPVLLDFAIAKIDLHNHTISKDTIGTVGYAAPEQFGLGPTDARSDIFAFGKMCQDLLSSTPAPNTPQRNLWKKIAAKCVHFHPEKRFQSISEILERLTYPGFIYGPSSKRIISFALPDFCTPCLQIEKQIGNSTYTLEIVFLEDSLLFAIDTIAWQIRPSDEGRMIQSDILFSFTGFTVLGEQEILLNKTDLQSLSLKTGVIL